MASKFLLVVVLATLVVLVAAAPATVYLNPYPETSGPVRKTMVISQFPSRASNRPYTPIFEGRQELGGRAQQQEEYEPDDDEQFDGPDGPEGLQFLWWLADCRRCVALFIYLFNLFITCDVQNKVSLFHFYGEHHKNLLFSSANTTGICSALTIFKGHWS